MKPDDTQSATDKTGTDRLGQAFQLASNDLYEASVAVEICKGFYHKHDRLADEPIDQQQIWGFVDQAVNWKLALALDRLTQKAGTDRASLKGLLREIDAARESGAHFTDEHRLQEAEANLATALKDNICKHLQTSRNAFMGHSLIGKNRQGVPLLDLMEYLGTLEFIMDALHVGICGAHLDFDTHRDAWDQRVSTWFERMLPKQDKPDE